MVAARSAAVMAGSCDGERMAVLYAFQRVVSKSASTFHPVRWEQPPQNEHTRSLERPRAVHGVVSYIPGPQLTLVLHARLSPSPGQ